MTSPNIIAVSTDDQSLTITWGDGERSVHDLSAMLAKRWAAPLRDPELFRLAEIVSGGREIGWPGTDITLSADGFWEENHPRPAAAKWMEPEEFRLWLADMGFSWDAAAEALNVSRRTIGNYLQGESEIPKTVWLACIHLAQQARTRATVPTREAASVVFLIERGRKSSANVLIVDCANNVRCKPAFEAEHYASYQTLELGFGSLPQNAQTPAFIANKFLQHA